MPAYKKPKTSKSGGKQAHSPTDSPSSVSSDRPCEYCDPGVCQQASCAGSNIQVSEPVCPKVRDSIGEVGKICARSVDSIDSKRSKGSKGKADKKGKKGAPQAQSPPPEGHPTSGPHGGGGGGGSSGRGGPLCSLVIYKWNFCEIVLAAIVFALVLVVVREACKIMCSTQRRRRRSC